MISFWTSENSPFFPDSSDPFVISRHDSFEAKQNIGIRN